MQPQTQARISADVVRVFVVGAHPMYRRGMAATLAAERDVHWVGEAGNSADAALTISSLAPDVVLVCQGDSRHIGPAAVNLLQPLLPQARFVLLTDSLDTRYRRRAADTGAWCELHEGASSAELVTAIFDAHRAPRGKLAAANDEAVPPRSALPPLGSDLTPSERKMLGLISRGLSNHQICAELDIALPTVKFHITNILSKLGVANRTAAVLVALRHKIVSLDD